MCINMWILTDNSIYRYICTCIRELYHLFFIYLENALRSRRIFSRNTGFCAFVAITNDNSYLFHQHTPNIIPKLNGLSVCFQHAVCSIGLDMHCALLMSNPRKADQKEYDAIYCGNGCCKTDQHQGCPWKP